MKENSLSLLVLVGVIVAIVAGLAILLYLTLSSPCPERPPKVAIASGTYQAVPESQMFRWLTWIDGSTHRRVTVDRAARRVRISYRRKDGRHVVETWRITHQSWMLPYP